MSFRIIGTGSSLPELVVKNEDLCTLFATTTKWIETRTGIKERRILKNETILSHAAKAAARAIQNAGIDPNTIDLIICPNLQNDFISPSLCCLLSEEIGSNCNQMFDLNMGCSGFLFALDVADAYILSKKADRVLIVCAEAMSKITDWEDRSTAILFGDGAGAVVLERGEGLISLTYEVKASHEYLYLPGFVGNCPYSDTNAKAEPNFIQMNGQEVYKFAVNTISTAINTELLKAEISTDDVNFFLLHQANIRILESVRERLKITKEKLPHNLDFYGNTSSASIPILLDELNNKNMIKKDDVLVFGAFGAGFAASVGIIKFN